MTSERPSDKCFEVVLPSRNIEYVLLKFVGKNSFEPLHAEAVRQMLQPFFSAII